MSATELRLYLDFDGVLHPFRPFPDHESVRALGHLRVCRDGREIYYHPDFFQHVQALADALREFPAVRIYVHSTWRGLFEDQRPDDIAEFLGPLAARYVRNIPSELRGRRVDVIRGDMHHDGFTGPWLVLDDIDDGFSAAGVHDHWVRPKTTVGLDQADLDDLVRKLRKLVTP